MNGGGPCDGPCSFQWMVVGDRTGRGSPAEDARLERASRLYDVRSRPLQVAAKAAGLDQLLAAPVADGEALLAARALQVAQVDAMGAGLAALRFAGAQGGLLAHGVPPRRGDSTPFAAGF